MNKINRFRHVRRNLFVVRSSLSIDVKVCSFLKHDVHRRFLLIDTAVAHNILYEVLCRFYIVRTDISVSSFVSSSLRQDTVSKNSVMFRSDEKRHKDSLISKNQHSIIVDFSIRLKMLKDLITIDIDLGQRL